MVNFDELPEAECLLKHAEDRIKRKKDIKILFTAETGEGKSYSGLRFLEKWYKRRFNEPFPIKNVVNSVEEGIVLSKDFIRKAEGMLIDDFINEVRKHCLDKKRVEKIIDKIDKEFMDSALSIKNIAGQINVIIHAAGILLSLPTLLEHGEQVESVSLGAGNTGKKFDLETNLRVAEFKFIDWKGGAESIRQNGIFKDFYELAEYETAKKKILYVVGKTHPLKFLNGHRALKSVLSKRPEILRAINIKYSGLVKDVCDYYDLHKDVVSICDISPNIGRGV